MNHANMESETMLKLSVISCNDTAGPSVLAPTMLVFGIILRMPIHPCGFLCNEKK